MAIYEKQINLANKVWTVVAYVEKSEVAEVPGLLQRNSLTGGLIVAIILLISILIIIRILIGKFDSIKKNIDNLNTGDKDLTKRLEIKHNNEISQVKKSVNIFVDTVHQTVKNIGESAFEAEVFCKPFLAIDLDCLIDFAIARVCECTKFNCHLLISLLTHFFVMFC